MPQIQEKIWESWIVNPFTRTVNVYDFELEKDTGQYRFEDDIAVCIYGDLSINIAGILS